MRGRMGWLSRGLGRRGIRGWCMRLMICRIGRMLILGMFIEMVMLCM